MAKMYQKMPFLKILLFLWHFCRFLWLGCLYWILVFSFHLVRQIHNFWYPYWLYLWEKNISWTKGGPFDFSRHQNARATAQTAWNELKFFLGGPRTLNNGKNFGAHFFQQKCQNDSPYSRDVHALANRAIISEFDYFVAKFANLVCLNNLFL